MHPALPPDVCWLLKPVLTSCSLWYRQSGGGEQGPEAMDEVEVVILRFSLAICNPGCLHLVLESVSPKAPYLLENRTPHPFQYRQVAIGKLLT